MKKVRITIWPFYYPEVRKMKISFMAMISPVIRGHVRNSRDIFCNSFVFTAVRFACVIRKNVKIKIIQWITKVYISIMRGTPLMLQLMVVYFGPYYIFGIRITASYRLSAVLIAFAVNYAAYFAEIYRGGIESMPVGQYEAAKLLGYNRVQTFFRIIFPQVIKRILPSVTNEVITLVKDTSLAFAIAYAEMFTTAKQIAAAQTSIIPLVAAGIFYLCV